MDKMTLYTIPDDTKILRFDATCKDNINKYQQKAQNYLVSEKAKSLDEGIKKGIEMVRGATPHN